MRGERKRERKRRGNGKEMEKENNEDATSVYTVAAEEAKGL
jgi:hypothetical protein